jgi:hypothetical protein
MMIRATTHWFFYCEADNGYFLAWEDVPDPLKAELDINGGLPCEGGGHPGPWCEGCRFGRSEEDG